MVQRVVVAGIIVKNNTVLLVKRSIKEDHRAGHWEVPGGKLEFGEKPEAGTLREIEEESGLKVRVIKPVSVFDFGDNSIHFVEINYLCEVENEQEVRLSEEHDDFQWATFGNIEKIEPMSPEMRKSILSLNLNS